MSELLAKTFRSRTFKLALLSIATFGAMAVGLIGYVYWSTVSFVRTRSDHAIATELASLQEAYSHAGRGGLITMIAQRIADKGFEGSVYLVSDPSFTPLAGNLENWPLAMKSFSGWASFSTDEGRRSVRAAFETLPDGSHVLVGKDIDRLDEFARMITVAMALGILLVFALAGLASTLVTRRTVGRIEAINATSRAIIQGGLSRRMPLRGTNDEWDELTANLNSMLDRIEALMGEVKQVTDNVAHDLRTPLTRIRGRLEKAYHKQRVSDNDQLLIGDTIADLDSILRMFSSLTRISQIEAHDRKDALRPVNLFEIANEVVDLFDAAAEDKGSRLKAVGVGGVHIRGDRDLLFDAIANLLDNAIKYGRDRGQIIVEVKENNDGPSISVADEGPGIPVEEYQHVFKRFYRLERSRCSPGNGLGLSLVAAVARFHSARIDMADNSPGLKVRILFPFPAASEREDRGQTAQPPP